MKKTFSFTLVILVLIGLIGCNQTSTIGENTYDRTEVSLTQEVTSGANLNEAQDAFEGGTRQEVTETFTTNPSRVAIFSYDILDMLNIMGIENTSIQLLGIPKSNLPSYLSEFSDDTYKNVGTLFLPSLDDLDLFNPELIVIGSRSQRAYDLLKETYPNADILDVSMVYGAYNEGLSRNVSYLKAIFPSISDALDTELNQLISEMTSIKDVASQTDALFILVNGESLSFYGKDGRFAVLYDEFGFMASDEKNDNGQTHGELVGYEYIAAINPSVIFLMDRGKAIGNASTISSVLDNQLIQNTTAGINDDIYELNGIAWYISAGGFESTQMMIDDLNVFISNQSHNQ